MKQKANMYGVHIAFKAGAKNVKKVAAHIFASAKLKFSGQ